MRVSELVEALLELPDQDAEVVVRISVDEDADTPSADDLIGEYCEVTDERNVSWEHGRAVIIGDWGEP